jgi:hypothetical protein
VRRNLLLALLAEISQSRTPGGAGAMIGETEERLGELREKLSPEESDAWVFAYVEDLERKKEREIERTSNWATS